MTALDISGAFEARPRSSPRPSFLPPLPSLSLLSGLMALLISRLALNPVSTQSVGSWGGAALPRGSGGEPVAAASCSLGDGFGVLFVGIDVLVDKFQLEKGDAA